MKDLEGKVAIVTGSGNGIGRAEAIALSKLGARVIVNDISRNAGTRGQERYSAHDVVDEIVSSGGEAVACVADVSSWDGGREIVQSAISAFGRLDILVNNAGIVSRARIDEISEAEWQKLFNVHVIGTVATKRHAAPIFRDQNSGVIVNTGSTSGLGHYSMPHYSAAKEAVQHFHLFMKHILLL